MTEEAEPFKVRESLPHQESKQMKARLLSAYILKETS